MPDLVTAFDGSLWLAAFAAVAGVIVQAVRLIYIRDDGGPMGRERDLATSILALVLIAGAGATVAALI